MFTCLHSTVVRVPVAAHTYVSIYYVAIFRVSLTQTYGVSQKNKRLCSLLTSAPQHFKTVTWPLYPTLPGISLALMLQLSSGMHYKKKSDFCPIWKCPSVHIRCRLVSHFLATSLPNPGMVKCHTMLCLFLKRCGHQLKHLKLILIFGAISLPFVQPPHDRSLMYGKTKQLVFHDMFCFTIPH